MTAVASRRTHSRRIRGDEISLRVTEKRLMSSVSALVLVVVLVPALLAFVVAGAKAQQPFLQCLPERPTTSSSSSLVADHLAVGSASKS